MTEQYDHDSTQHPAPRTLEERLHRRTLALVSGGAAIALVTGLGGLTAGALGSGLIGSVQAGSTTTAPGSGGSTGAGSGFGSGTGTNGSGRSGGTSGGFGGGSSQQQGGTGAGTSSQSSAAASAAQTAGVVTIVSELQYGQGEAAGTGIVLTASGTILTNNHVIAGATKIEVTDEATGESYTAQVVGTDAVHDVAVLKLSGASGLTTAKLDTDDDLMIGDDVTSVGNAGGTGNLIAAAGTVSDLDQSITVSNEETGKAESLAGLIEIDADVVSGDSGGPLVDSEGDVVGITTAASQGSAEVTGFAIPIEDAMAIAKQIEAGTASDTVVIGLPAFLGVELAQSQTAGSGAVVGGVLAGTPAQTAGLTEGDVITAVDVTAVADGDALSAAIAAHAVGDSVRIGYTDASSVAHTVTVTLVGGPAA